MYEFSKTSNKPGKREYSHPNFSRGRRDLLPLIHRRGAAGAGGVGEPADSLFVGSSRDMADVASEIVALRSRLSGVESRLQASLARCDHVRDENQHLWSLLADQAPDLLRNAQMSSHESSFDLSPIQIPPSHGSDAVTPLTYAAHFTQLHQKLHVILQQIPTDSLQTTAGEQPQAKRQRQARGPRRKRVEQPSQPVALPLEEHLQQKPTSPQHIYARDERTHTSYFETDSPIQI